MRGRGGNNNNNQNRKGPNPLTRSYESNGPDVKIRGSAQQIAEKYTTLARDAQMSGDRVMAENYLQHAEHYNRLIMAAQAQMPQQPQRDNRDDDQDEDEDGFTPQANEQGNRRQQNNGSGPQPVIEGVPAEVALNQETASQPQASAAGPDAEASEAGEGAGTAEAAAPAEEEAPAPRRARRPRRTTRARSEGDEQPSGGDEEPVTEAAQ